MSPKKLLWRSALTLSLISLCACESKQASSNSDKQNLVEIKPFNTTFVSLGSGENYREAGNSYLLTNLPSILLFDANGNATGQITLSDNDTYATLYMVDEKVLLYETYIDTFNNIPCRKGSYELRA